ncbi:MAG: hypothetical protein KKB59_20015 [Spirochaetes bacterium]|nr:hypothetical protein [Spirochaetota bacterium]
MNWTALVSEVINRLPVERFLSRTPDNKKRLEELQEILGEANPKKAESEIQERPQRQVHLEPRKSEVSTEETIAYENREIVKRLRLIADHCVQRFRIFGKPCDCGQFRHILEIEGLCEEAVQMVDNPDIYYSIIKIGKEIEPKVTLEAIGSGQYDEEYPKYARLYRDLCKQLGFSGEIDRDLIEKPEPGKYFPKEVEAHE